MKNIMSEIVGAKIHLKSLEWKAAEIIANNDIMMEMIDNGLVKPGVPIAMVERLRKHQNQRFDPYDRKAEMKIVS